MNRGNLILIVDDDTLVAQTHATIVKNIGYNAATQSDPEKVEGEIGSRSEIEMVLLDIRMPRLSGMDLLPRIKRRRPDIGVVMATVVNDIEHAVIAIKSGAYNYLLKPLQPERVEKVLQSYFLNQPKRLINDSNFAPFITCAPVFDNIFRTVKSYAEADVTVLVQGETGTGKEIVANIIHSLSPRSSDRFLAVNVAALSTQLFESELFGYKRGAFTGAIQDHAGYFEEAGTGTIFLDEIGELDVEQQKKLLRVLQTRRYSRIGETTERELKARIILATNCNLRKEVSEGKFREDLFYRLGSHSITIPPLRDRNNDIELLSNYFLQKYTSQFGRQIEGFYPEAIEILKRYSFPGNVRELEGIISSSVLLEQSTFVRPGTLPIHVQISDNNETDLESLRYKTIMKVLAECDGNQTKAAQKLGIARGTLNRLLKEYREQKK